MLPQPLAAQEFLAVVFAKDLWTQTKRQKGGIHSHSLIHELGIAGAGAEAPVVAQNVRYNSMQQIQVGLSKRN